MQIFIKLLKKNFQWNKLFKMQIKLQNNTKKDKIQK